MKIVYCLNSISEMGGMAVVTIAKANAMAELPGYEVAVCVTDYKPTETALRLSPRVKLVDLQVGYYKDDWKSRFHVLKGIFLKRRIHRKRLKMVLEELQPDVVVSVGQSEKYLLPGIAGSASKVRELHYCTRYRRYRASSISQRVVARVVEWYDFKIKSRYYDAIVLLTQRDKSENWAKNKKASVIPDPLCVDAPQASASLHSKRIVAIGRLEEQKDFTQLLEVFGNVARADKECRLEIYGDGSQRNKLLAKIKELGMENRAFLKGMVSDPVAALKGATCLALTSVYEGFSMVLIEAMACGVPVVSYDCPCGPSDIIDDGLDGFLIKPGEKGEMADKILFLISDDTLRDSMGKAAVVKSQRYYLDNVVSQWDGLFKDLLANNRR